VFDLEGEVIEVGMVGLDVDRALDRRPKEMRDDLAEVSSDVVSGVVRHRDIDQGANPILDRRIGFTGSSGTNWLGGQRFSLKRGP